jgi:hypothetical protein
MDSGPQSWNLYKALLSLPPPSVMTWLAVPSREIFLGTQSNSPTKVLQLFSDLADKANKDTMERIKALAQRLSVKRTS